MNDLPFVSVILPTYNRANSLQRSVDSVLNQSHENLELIIVDDGSTDHTKDVLESYSYDARLRIINHSAPKGPGAARNAGVEIARSTWIAFQDSDDAWHREKIRMQLQHAQKHPAFDFIACYSRSMTDDGSVQWTFTENLRQLENDPQSFFLRPLRFIPPTWLLRKAAFEKAGRFRTDMASAEDWELMLRLAKVARCSSVDACLVDKYYSRDGVYENMQRRHRGLKAVVALHRQLWATTGRLQDLSRFHSETAERMLKNKEYVLSLKWTLTALRINAKNSQAWACLLSFWGGYHLYGRLMRALGHHRS